MAKPKSTSVDSQDSTQNQEKPLKPGQKIGAHGKPVPLSEDERKYRDWSKEECVEHIRDLQKKFPDMYITRNWFRHHSLISDSTWNRHFGTFQEYKRSAGVTLSRHAGRLEKAIAKHAGHDEIEKFTDHKRGYAGKYQKPASGRFQTVLVCSDVHDEFCDPFWRRIFLETVERVEPEIVVLNGDIFDLAEFSKYDQDPREWDIVRKMKIALDFIRDIREAAPEAQIDFIEGNHEFRLFRHLAEATPALKAILADLHGYDIPKLLGIDQFEVNFIGNANLKAWTEKDIKKELNRNYKIYFDSFLCCHYPDRRKLGMPGLGGHHHKHEVWPVRLPNGQPGEFHQMGGGHYRAADYCDGELWHLGFMIAHVDTLTRNVNFEYVPVTDHAVVGGKWYLRSPEEELT